MHSIYRQFVNGPEFPFGEPWWHLNDDGWELGNLDGPWRSVGRTFPVLTGKPPRGRGEGECDFPPGGWKTHHKSSFTRPDRRMGTWWRGDWGIKHPSGETRNPAGAKARTSRGEVPGGHLCSSSPSLERLGRQARDPLRLLGCQTSLFLQKSLLNCRGQRHKNVFFFFLFLFKASPLPTPSEWAGRAAVGRGEIATEGMQVGMTVGDDEG